MNDLESDKDYQIEVRKCTNKVSNGKICGCIQTVIIQRFNAEYQEPNKWLYDCVKCSKYLPGDSELIEVIKEAGEIRKIPNGYTGDLHHYQMRQRI